MNLFEINLLALLYPHITNLKVEIMSKMLDLSKKILTKVSFDRSLFQKELSKAYNLLVIEEKVMLKFWCLATFGYQYRDIIIEVCRKVTRS